MSRPTASIASMPLGDLPLSRGSLDRAAHRRAEPDLVPKLLADPATRVVVIVAESMEVLPDGALAVRPPAPDDRHRLAFFLGEEVTTEAADPDSGTERTAYLAVVGDPTESGHDDWQTLRNAGVDLSDRDAGIFTTAQALANWHAAHQFCPRCGAPTEPEQAGWIRRCTRDRSEHYPRTDPAVIMAVVDDDDRLLLGRNAQWPEGRFSVLAGFVEPGESFEAAVAREVEEEVGIAGHRRDLPGEPAVAVPVVRHGRVPRPGHDDVSPSGHRRDGRGAVVHPRRVPKRVDHQGDSHPERDLDRPAADRALVGTAHRRDRRRLLVGD